MPKELKNGIQILEGQTVVLVKYKKSKYCFEHETITQEVRGLLKF